MEKHKLQRLSVFAIPQGEGAGEVRLSYEGSLGPDLAIYLRFSVEHPYLALYIARAGIHDAKPYCGIVVSEESNHDL